MTIDRVTYPRVTIQLVYVLLLSALLLSLGMLAPAGSQSPQAQPLLLQLASVQPDAAVRVIVQQQEPAANNHVEQAAIQLGGVVTDRLDLISGFVVQLPARAALELSKLAGVRWVSLDTPVVDNANSTTCTACIDTSRLQNAYISTLGVDKLWNEQPYLHGQGITVAVVDSGINNSQDLVPSRILAAEKFNSFTNSSNDKFGHGTHVAGIIGGNGTTSNGAYIGIAPKVNVINLKVSDDQGAGLTSDVVNALEWIYNHKATYNIRVVNISLNSSVAESYHNNPIAAAAEILWFNKIVVVVSAGNEKSPLYPPANDPFVITVGATNDQGTPNPADDVLAGYSAYGTTVDGITKPELVAPGSNIISVLSSTGTTLAKEHPNHIVDKRYFRMSGTSMAAPMVTGVVALLLQDEPDLTPDQVKYRLMATARPFSSGATAGYVDAYAAVHGTTTASANTGIEASALLWLGEDGITWDSKSWNSKSWNSVNWNAKSWNSKSWNSVSWNSDYWGD